MMTINILDTCAFVVTILLKSLKTSFITGTKLSFSGNYTPPPPRNLQFCQNYSVDVHQSNSKSLNTCLGI